MDKLIIAQLLGGYVRAYVADTTDTAETARLLHDTSPVCASAMGRAMTGALFMGSMLKNEADRVTVTFAGDGPIGRIVCVSDADGHVKAYCDNPRVDLPMRADGKLDVGGAVGKNGYLTVIKDQGFGEPYIGRVPLRSGEIAEDYAYYFAKSEQTPCLMSLGVLCGGEGVLASAGVFVQPMPGCPDSALDALEEVDFSNISHKLRDAGSADALFARLTEGLDAEILETRELGFLCDCNRARIEQALLSLGEAELRDIIERDKKAELNCSFCNKTYTFTEEELRTLLAEGMKPAAGE